MPDDVAKLKQQVRALSDGLHVIAEYLREAFPDSADPIFQKLMELELFNKHATPMRYHPESIESYVKVLREIQQYIFPEEEDLHFVTEWQIVLDRKTRPELLALRLWSKRQLHSNSDEFYRSVEEMLEVRARASLAYVLNNNHAETLATELLDAAAKSRQACDDS